MANEPTDDSPRLPVHDTEVMLVVADTSGSMREHGKAMLARNLIAHIREQARLGNGPPWLGEPILVWWSTKAEAVMPPADQDLPAWPIGGRARAPALLTTLDGLVPAGRPARLLFLSDGHLAGDDLDALKAWQRRHPDVSTRALAIGPDAAPALLKKVADPDGVFHAEEVVLALASWTLPRQRELPAFIADLTAPEGGAR